MWKKTARKKFNLRQNAWLEFIFLLQTGDSGGPMVIQREDKRFLLAGVWPLVISYEIYRLSRWFWFYLVLIIGEWCDFNWIICYWIILPGHLMGHWLCGTKSTWSLYKNIWISRMDQSNFAVLATFWADAMIVSFIGLRTRDSFKL